MGKKLIIANWKMNLTINEASLFVHKLDALIDDHKGVEVVLAPTLLALQPVHLSHYQLTLEPNTLFAAKPPPLPAATSAPATASISRSTASRRACATAARGGLNFQVQQPVQMIFLRA